MSGLDYLVVYLHAESGRNSDFYLSWSPTCVDLMNKLHVVKELNLKNKNVKTLK